MISFLAQALRGALGGVGLGAGVPAQPAEHDPLERSVGVAVPSPVEPVALGAPGGRGQRGDPAEHGERGLGT